MNETIRIEMKMPTAEAAKAHFPEAKKQFTTGTSGLALKTAHITPTITLEKTTVAVEIKFPNKQIAKIMLPMFQKQMNEAVAKEKKTKGSCIETKVTLK